MTRASLGHQQCQCAGQRQTTQRTECGGQQEPSVLAPVVPPRRHWHSHCSSGAPRPNNHPPHDRRHTGRQPSGRPTDPRQPDKGRCWGGNQCPRPASSRPVDAAGSRTRAAGCQPPRHHSDYARDHHRQRDSELKDSPPKRDRTAGDRPQPPSRFRSGTPIGLPVPGIPRIHQLATVPTWSDRARS
jgi:hypothetical protein